MQESVVAGIIWLSSSPAGAGFFFLWTKRTKQFDPQRCYRQKQEVSSSIFFCLWVSSGGQHLSKPDKKNAYYYFFFQIWAGTCSACLQCSSEAAAESIVHQGREVSVPCFRSVISGIGGHHQPVFYPQSNGQTERKKQEMETALHYLASGNPSPWSKQRIWVEYAHNPLPSFATGFMPFQCSRWYQPTLSPE